MPSRTLGNDVNSSELDISIDILEQSVTVLSCSKTFCPFAFTDLNETIQSYGCIPTPHEIRTMRVEHAKTWAYHSNYREPYTDAIRWLKENWYPHKIVDTELLNERSDWSRYTQPRDLGTPNPGGDYMDITNDILTVGHFCELEGDAVSYLVHMYIDWDIRAYVTNVYALDRHGLIVGTRYASLEDEDARGFRMGYHQLVLTGLGVRIPKTILLRLDYDRSREQTEPAIVHSNLCEAQQKDWYLQLFRQSSGQVA